MVSRPFPVALARGKHLFPFRTEKLSPSAPMVLGSQGPGRVGRRRFIYAHEPPQGAARGVVGSLQNQAHPVLRGLRRPRPARNIRARSLRREGAARHSGASSPTDRTQAHLLVRRHDPRTPRAQPAAQRLPVRVLSRLHLAREALCIGDSARLVLVDLPVDAVVVLEQQERADQTQRPNKALHGQLCVRR